MSQISENITKTRIPVWLLVLIPVLIAAAFYIGMNVGNYNDSLSAFTKNSETSEAEPESHDASPTGAITLSEQAKINIGLTTDIAEFRTVEHIVRVPGAVSAHPNSIAYVNTRIEGRVEKLLADIGDTVVSGQVLARVQSRRFGNPIPSVNITAPISGTITKRNVFSGSSVDPLMPLFEIMDLSTVIIEGEVFEDYVPSLNIGQRSRIHLNAYPDEIFQGEITFISSVLDHESRTAKIWVSVENRLGKLKPGMFGVVAIVVGSNPESIAVRINAVIKDGPNKFVFVENGEFYEKIDVVTGLSDDIYIEILDGLYLGDIVITQGNHQLLAVATRPQAAGVVDESKPHGH